MKYKSITMLLTAVLLFSGCAQQPEMKCFKQTYQETNYDAERNDLSSSDTKRGEKVIVKENCYETPSNSQGILNVYTSALLGAGMFLLLRH